MSTQIYVNSPFKKPNSSDTYIGLSLNLQSFGFSVQHTLYLNLIQTTLDSFHSYVLLNLSFTLQYQILTPPISYPEQCIDKFDPFSPILPSFINQFKFSLVEMYQYTPTIRSFILLHIPLDIDNTAPCSTLYTMMVLVCRRRRRKGIVYQLHKMCLTLIIHNLNFTVLYRITHKG